METKQPHHSLHTLEQKIWVVGVMLVILLTAMFLFGLAGFKVFLSMTFVAGIFYIILRAFQLEWYEHSIFSVILSLGLYPAYTYWLSLLIGSLHVSMLVSLAFLAIIAILINVTHSISLPKKQLLIITAFVLIGLVLFLLAYFLVVKHLPVPDYVQQYLECIKSSTAADCSRKY